MGDLVWCQLIEQCIEQFTTESAAKADLRDRLHYCDEYDLWYKLYLLGPDDEVRKRLCMKIKALLGV